MVEFVVQLDDPRTEDVRALLETHLAFARRHSLPGEVYALDIPGLLAEGVAFFSIREDGALLGVGALKQLDAVHAEVKSMHTSEAARGRGIGRTMLAHLVGLARRRGCTRVSLETGTMAAFAPARALYASMGFETCEPFAEYSPSPNSLCMTLELGNVSLWLMPHEGDYPRLKELIGRASDRFDTARFEPHLTLARIRAQRRELIEALRTWSETVGSIELIVDEIRRYGELRRSLVIDLEPSNAWRTLRSSARSTLGDDIVLDATRPHVSLAYRPLDDREFEQARVDLDPRLSSIRFDRAELWRVGANPERLEPQHWRKLD